MFKMTVNTDNDAFVGHEATEVARILRSVEYRIRRGELAGALLDVNGNTVGRYCLDDSREG